MWHFKKATQSLSTKDIKYHTFFIIFLNKFYKYTTLKRFYNLLSITNFNFLNVFKTFIQKLPKNKFLTYIYILAKLLHVQLFIHFMP